ncbi:Cell division control protein 6-like protein [Thalictrum thalictroides]|uniref:Cell division control protein 6-like protein n=1 Tax=Thalictrum thalictroides TaxID=46969 RepID=A0A7J6WAR7_THATH|nr:Cell division control protein 6-like protein [Thalictrum thalictroides]
MSIVKELKEALHVSSASLAIVCREDEQKRVFEFFRTSIQEERGGSLYVCGCPGTGKTLTIDKVKQNLLDWVKEILEMYQPLKKVNHASSALQNLENLFSKKKQWSNKKMMLFHMMSLISKHWIYVSEWLEVEELEVSATMVSSSSSDASSEARFQEALLSDRAYDVVRVSMCPHFDDFEDFHSRLPVFAERVIFHELEYHIHDIFPRYPEKVNQERWDWFRVLLEREDFRPIRDICRTWWIYGTYALRICESCRVASLFAGVGLNQVEPLPEVGDDLWIYGTYALRICESCRIGSLFAGVGLNQVEPLPEVGDDDSAVEPAEVIEIPNDDPDEATPIPPENPAVVEDKGPDNCESSSEELGDERPAKRPKK